MAKEKEATKESVYEEIRERRFDGKMYRKESKLSLSEELVKEGKIKKIRSKYYAPEFAPTAEKVYKKVEEAGKDGVSLNAAEKELIEPLKEEGKVKTAYQKYFLPEYAPLTKKEVVERLLDSGYLKRMRSKYLFVRGFESVKPEVKREERPPSFLEFAKRVQEIYLRMAGEYRQSVRIMPLIEELTSKMDITRITAEKWILELPRIFLGRVDLRPFPSERGLKMEDGSEVARIYLERGIVGL